MPVRHEVKAQSESGFACFPLRRVVLATLPGALFGLIFILRSSWVFQGQRRFTLFDDAMISMSYARTMADGGGLVWFPGAPRVEGITNPLWTFLMAALHAVGLSASMVSLSIMLIGLACVVASAVLCARIVSQLLPSSTWAPVLAAFAASVCYPVLYWSLRGMEVGFLLLVALALISAVITWTDQVRMPDDSGAGRRTLAFAAVLIMIGLATRLDFALVAIVCVSWAAWVAPYGSRRRVALPLGGAIVGTLVVMTWARVAYYGEVTPNTYTLKVGGISLVDRLGRGIVTDLKVAPLVALCAIAALLLVRMADARTKRIVALLVAVGAGVIAYSTYVGGDAWEFMPNRYVAPLLVVMVILASAAIEALVRREVTVSTREAVVGSLLLAVSSVGLSAIVIVFDGDLVLGRYFSASRLVLGLGVMAVLIVVFVASMLLSRGEVTTTAAAATGVLLIFLAGGVWSINWVRDGGYAVVDTQTQTERGLALGEVTRADAVIATSYAGAPIYYSRRAGIDLLGKSDAVIASVAPRGSFYPGHNKWDYSISVLERRPDVVAEFARPPTPTEFFAIEEIYARRCLGGVTADAGVWVLKASTQVDLDDPSFVPCPSAGRPGATFP